MKRVRLGVIAAVAGTTATAILGGCASNQGNVAKPADAAKGTVTISIDVPFHPIFDYVMANKATYFGKSGYKVAFKVMDATTQVPAFGRGDVQVITTVPSFMPTIKSQYNIDTKYFFPMARWTPGPQLLVRAGSSARSIEDLKGKKVAIAPLTSRFGAEQAAVLAATGSTIQDYFKLAQTDAAAQQLTLGRVDAAFLEAPATYPLLQAGFKPIFSVQDAFKKAFGDPAVMNGGFIAATAFVDKNPKFVDALVQATQDAWKQFQQSPDHVIADATKVSGISGKELRQVGEVLNLAKMSDDQKKVTQRDVQTWTKMFPLLQKSGFIKQAPSDPAALFAVTGK
jgi:ABC-type nitrate/sulfonate/bicarbonate transport system substrate-binding protein